MELWRHIGANTDVHGPGKAANAGGAATSGLELSQNSARLSWSREEVDGYLQRIMQGLHASCVQHGGGDGWVDSVKGPNIAGFITVADTMMDRGVAWQRLDSDRRR